MTTLRELDPSDAPLMLEWMHDPDVQKGFRRAMSSMTLDDARRFCELARLPPGGPRGGDDLHYAIAGGGGEYLGTISLKHVDLENRSAEYAIVLRKKAQGRGVAREATRLLLEKAFGELRLHRVYLNVLSDNEKAIRLYERCGFAFEGEFREHLFLNGRFVNWKWYAILETEFGRSGAG